jgi:ribonuclease R
VDHYVEGLVHISALADDYYRYTEGSHALLGERTRRTYRLGDHVRVQIARVDLGRRMIDLALEQVIPALSGEGSDAVERAHRAKRRPRAAAEKPPAHRASRSPRKQRDAKSRPPRRPRAQRPGQKERAPRKKR